MLSGKLVFNLLRSKLKINLDNRTSTLIRIIGENENKDKLIYEKSNPAANFWIIRKTWSGPNVDQETQAEYFWNLLLCLLL